MTVTIVIDDKNGGDGWMARRDGNESLKNRATARQQNAIVDPKKMQPTGDISVSKWLFTVLLLAGVLQSSQSVVGQDRTTPPVRQADEVYFPIAPEFSEPLEGDYLPHDGFPRGEDLPQRWVRRSGERSVARGGHVEIPEPLLFDLVRPLGARKGELEFNTLGIFPWASSSRNLEDDPFGPGPTTFDREGIEWAPEVEYAIADNFAIEFEFPFEGSVLEEYKLGLQWTIGTAFDEHYIHGFQVLIEPTTDWENWNSTLLYLGGVRFDETWSALFMLGGRMNLEGPRTSDTFEKLVNASLFADMTESTVWGLETNYAARVDGTSNFILAPQVHWQLTQNLEIQWGLGFGVASEGSEQSFIVRPIYSR